MLQRLNTQKYDKYLGQKKTSNLTDLQTMLGDDKNILPLFSDTYSLLRNASHNIA